MVDRDGIHQTRAGRTWLAAHLRVELLVLPADGPQANPLERVWGNAHNHVTRHHTRQRRRDLLADLARPGAHHEPWRYELGSVEETADVRAEYRQQSAPPRVLRRPECSVHHVVWSRWRKR